MNDISLLSLLRTIDNFKDRTTELFIFAMHYMDWALYRTYILDVACPFI